jgi:hypothetical protein
MAALSQLSYGPAKSDCSEPFWFLRHGTGLCPFRLNGRSSRGCGTLFGRAAQCAARLHTVIESRETFDEAG